MVKDKIKTKNKKRYYNEIVFSHEQTENIIYMYKHGYSTVKIGEKYNVSYRTIARFLEKNGIPRTGVGRRKYKLNEHYFDEIDTPNKAYMLGFFYADGSNCKNKSTVVMSLQEEDKEILEKIRLEVGSEKPLEYLNYSNKTNGGYKYKNQYRLLFFSSHMCSMLEKYGMVPNKSLVLKFPDKLPENLYSHFIRGYMDGDGCILKRTEKNKNYAVTIISTKEFCEKVQEIIKKHVGINSYIYEASNHNQITMVLGVYGKYQTIKFLNYLYHDADLYMYRKYQIYQSYLNEEKCFS